MKTKKFFMVLVALFMGSQMAIFAQGKKEGKMDRKQFGQEQMQKMQCNQLINALALDDAETAKFKPVYTKYMEEMRAVRDMNPRAPRSTLTDAEVEQVIKARFAQSRKMLDIREKYYNEFRKILSPKQIAKIGVSDSYNLRISAIISLHSFGSPGPLLNMIPSGFVLKISSAVVCAG